MRFIKKEDKQAYIAANEEERLGGFMLKIIASEKAFRPSMYDLSIEDYHQNPGISRSNLMEFKRSPYHYSNLS
ncbi:hypothetical protein RICGR_0417 [Rickettsiella grylli]|uniref:Uncharacterized protein n=1 Tax=Rickettsiella grylli TaxID=59196 RepID=A8PLG3_9COXI|nr:hypothetical protein RICGR_0417 [Rickettsiella grylli]